MIDQLKTHVEGDILAHPVHKRVYSVDASIYEIEPIVIVQPKTKEALLATVQISKEHNVPIIPRGAGTGISGGAVGMGCVIDTSRYLNQILSIDPQKKTVICAPGVVQDTLNQALFPFGLRLGPETSTGNRATIGGMVANNSAGSHSLKYGQMADHLLSVELATADGCLKTFSSLSKEEWLKKIQQDSLFALFDQIRTTKKNAIEKSSPDVPRKVTGYNLESLLKAFPLNPATLIAGSEGTLGVITEITLNLVDLLKHPRLAIFPYRSFQEAMEDVKYHLSTYPIAVEMIDHHIIQAAKCSPSMKGKTNWIPEGCACLIGVQYENSLPPIKKAILGYDREFWEMRKSGLALLLSKRSYSRAIAFVEDIAVHPKRLPEFMEAFIDLLKKHKKECGIYGHVGSGVMHLRPYINLQNLSEFNIMKQIMEEVTTLTKKFKGALSGEHGDGLLRSQLNETMYGKEVYQSFISLKEAFDPKYLMNPGKIVNAPPFEENLRLSPKSALQHIETFQDFTKEGGFTLAVDLCNGNGQCRKKEGVMCPSFQATNDELTTTRARAQALRGIIHGKLPLDTLTSDALHELLDLCISCKGCLSECPSEINMAKMKSEVLYQRHKKLGVPLRDRLLGSLDTFYSLPLISSLSPPKFLLNLLDIAPQRTLPRFAKQRFSRLPLPPTGEGSPVVLFIDTFTEFHRPKVGLAAYTLLSSLGYKVLTPAWSCCGRPQLSKGLLPEAKKRADTLTQKLQPFIEKNIPIIGLEPSCLFTIKHDFEALNGANFLNHCMMLETFLLQHADTLMLPNQPIYIHTHCHQKAHQKTPDTYTLLKSLSKNVHEIKSGCCGMAGSFGYEKEHYELSQKIGELALFPALKKIPSNALVIANGFSCSCQIHDQLHLETTHISTLIQKAV